jgi:hypothetical protein
VRVGIFALEDIKPDEEVTIEFDYRYDTDRYSAECPCGNDSCLVDDVCGQAARLNGLVWFVYSWLISDGRLADRRFHQGRSDPKVSQIDTSNIAKSRTSRRSLSLAVAVPSGTKAAPPPAGVVLRAGPQEVVGQGPGRPQEDDPERLCLGQGQRQVVR